MKKTISKFISNEEGSGLILALMTLMVLAVLGASLGAITIGSHRLGAVNRDDTSAYYIAEAGANQAYEEIERLVLSSYEESNDSEDVFFEKLQNKLTDLQNFTILDQTEFEGSNSHATVQISELEKEDKTRSYQIRSEGSVSGRSRVVEKDFEVTYVKEESAIEVPKLPEGAKIIFNTAVNQSGNRNRNIVDASSNWKVYEELSKSFPASNMFEPIDNVDSKTIITTEKNQISNVKVDTLDLQHLKVEGEGTLNIYVKENLSFTGDFNQHDSDNVRIFYAGDNSLTIPSNYNFNGSIFSNSKKSNVDIGGRVNYNGVLITNGYTIELNTRGQNSDAIYAYIIGVNATVDVGNHTNFFGSLIADSFNIASNANISYSDEYEGHYLLNLRDFNGETEIITSKPVIEPK